MVDDHDVVGELLGLLEIVGGEQHRDPPVAQVRDHPSDELTTGRIDPGGGFVEEGDIGTTDEGQCERESLLFAARHRTPGGGTMIGQPDEVEQFIGIDGVVVVGGEEVEGLGRTHAGGDSTGLEHHADTGDEAAMVGDGVESEHPDRTGGGAAIALEGLDGRGLACPVGSEQSGDPSGHGGEGEAVDGNTIAVANGEVGDLDRGLRLRSNHDLTLPGRRLRFRTVIDVRRIRTEYDIVRASLARRGDEGALRDLARVAELDERSRQIAAERDDLRARVNGLSKEVGQLRRDGDVAGAEALQEQSRTLGEREREVATAADEIAALIRDLLLHIPNLPSADCPDGRGEADNVEIKRVGAGDDPAAWSEHQRVPHWDIGTELGILDLERAVKMSGAMFTMFRGQGATLSRALCQVALDRNADAFEEVRPPTVVLTDTMISTGHLPKFIDDAYHLERDDLWAIPTAEVPLTSLARDEILRGADLPMRLMAQTACFRREAGSAGRDTRGLLRVHEFDKVEILAYATPEQAPALHEELLARAEGLIGALGLTYRVLDLCTGDIGNSSARTYDIEVYAPGVDQWLEVSSVSWFTDYQARRANIRYKVEGAKGNEIAHTLNGSALAVPRVWAAVVETHRQPDGTVRIPEILQPYMRGATSIG